MIVYLALYPRSGNSFLQRIVQYHLGFRPSPIKAGINSPTAAVSYLKATAGEIELQNIDDVVVEVRRKDAKTWFKTLLPIGLPMLTSERRKRLAASDHPFFIKTHDLPFEDYLPGEYVIHGVRHPGASLWSYFRYLNDVDLSKRGTASLFGGRPPTLENVIAGAVPFGDWSSYHAAWDRVREQTGNRFLLLRYEEMTADQKATAAACGALLALPTKSGARGRAVNFSALQSRMSNFDLRGTSEGYERYYSSRQLDLLWQTHGAWGARFGYQSPDHSAAMPDEQIRRLTQMVAAAWTAGEAQAAQTPRSAAGFAASRGAGLASKAFRHASRWLFNNRG